MLPKHKAMSYGRMKHEEQRLRQEIAGLMLEAERTDRREDKLYGDARTHVVKVSSGGVNSVVHN
jgi:hypothetical protein